MAYLRLVDPKMQVVNTARFNRCLKYRASYFGIFHSVAWLLHLSVTDNLAHRIIAIAFCCVARSPMPKQNKCFVNLHKTEIGCKTKTMWRKNRKNFIPFILSVVIVRPFYTLWILWMAYRTMKCKNCLFSRLILFCCLCLRFTMFSTGCAHLHKHLAHTRTLIHFIKTYYVFIYHSSRKKKIPQTEDRENTEQKLQRRKPKENTLKTHRFSYMNLDFRLSILYTSFGCLWAQHNERSMDYVCCSDAYPIVWLVMIMCIDISVIAIALFKRNLVNALRWVFLWFG